MSKVIKLGNYKGIDVSVEKQAVTEEEVNNEIQRLLMSSTKLVDKEGTVENGDVTTIDFEGFKDGVAFEGGKGENYQLEIGSGQFIPGFEDQMIGMNCGETRDLNLTFPENYGATDLAGAAVVFKVTVHKISTKVQAELNDEFVESLKAPEIHTVEDLKSNIRTSLEVYHEQNYMAAKENAVLGKLIEESEVEVEEQDIEKAVEQHISHIRMELLGQGMQLEQYLEMIGSNLENLNQQLRPTAVNQVKFEAIIDEIVKLENLHTTDEEANAQVESIANANQMDKETVLEKVKLEDLKRDLTRLKANQLVMEHANIK